MRIFLLSIIATFVCGTVHGGLPLVINTHPFQIAAAEAWSVLKETGNPLDALVEGLNRCEREQCGFAVGAGGGQDESGETTLDAMIMDGSDLNVGAVANIREIKDPIKVAKLVLQHTKHSILTGNQATEFAVKMGFVRESLTTNRSRQKHNNWLNNNCQHNYWTNVVPDPKRFCGPYKVKDILDHSSNNVDFLSRGHDTINMVVIDEKGKMFAGTTTNGLMFKIPGRVGDATIPGGGTYVNSKYGAAVCTGNGDLMMRHSPSFLAVELMRNGLSPRKAADEVMRRILENNWAISPYAAILVVDKNGNYAVTCKSPSTGFFTISIADERGVRLENTTCIP